LTTKLSDENFSFIDFEAIPQANLLIKRSRQKRIEPKVMSLLILLASKNGDVVTRAEILETLWPKMIVGDEVISQLIYTLRNALSDDAKNPKYIETIPKKGYRFIAKINVSETTAIEKNDAGLTTELVKDKNRSNQKTNLLLSCGLIIFLMFMLIWFLNNHFSTEKVTNLTIKNILPVTQSVALERSFSFHESHNKMAYINHQEESIELYIKTLGKDQSQRITNNLWIESYPLWLDEKTLAYIREKSGIYQIVRQQLDKKPDIIYESKISIFNLTLNTSKGSKLTFIEYDNYQHSKLHELKTLDLESTKVSYLHDSVINLPSNIRIPIYSVDGEVLYFFNNTNKVKEIVSLDLSNSQYRVVTNKFSWVDYIAILDEDSLLVSGELSATKGIWQVNIKDGSIKSILPSSGGQRITRALFKNGQIYYGTYKTSTNQTIANIKDQTFDTLPKLNSDANEYFGIYSKDNQSIYFVSNRTGFYEIWSYDVNSQKTKKITNLQASFIYKPILSNSEEHFAVVYEKDSLILATISLATGKPESESKIPAMKYPLAWSNDDRNIYISEHKKHINIYSYDRETLTENLVQPKAGLFANESIDGETFTLIDYNRGGLTSKNTGNGKTTVLSTSINSLDALRPGELKVVNNSIFAVEKDGHKRRLKQYLIKTANQKQSEKVLMDLPNYASVTDFNANATKALFFKSTFPKGDIMTIQFEQ